MSMLLKIQIVEPKIIQKLILPKAPGTYLLNITSTLNTSFIKTLKIVLLVDRFKNNSTQQALAINDLVNILLVSVQDL